MHVGFSRQALIAKKFKDRSSCFNWTKDFIKDSKVSIGFLIKNDRAIKNQTWPERAKMNELYVKKKRKEWIVLKFNFESEKKWDM